MTKKLVIIKGRGTANEQRIKTNITLYLVRGRWVAIPEE